MTQVENSAVIGGKPVESPEITAELKAAVAQAIKDQFAVTDAWKPRDKVRFIVECPSGQKCLCKHLTTMDLLEADLIDEIDFFTKRLFPSGVDAQGNPVEQQEDTDDMAPIWELLRDVNKRARFMALLNKIMVVGVVRPIIIDDGIAVVKNKVKLGVKDVVPQEGQVLASAIDFADRMAIFSELNKPLSQITPFRKEQALSMASMEPVQKPESPA